MTFIAYLSLLGFNNTFVRFLPKSKNRNQEIDTGLVSVALASAVVGGLYTLFIPNFVPRFAVLHQNVLFGLGFVLFCIGAAINLVTDSIFVAYRSAGYNLLIDGVLASAVLLILPVSLISLGAYGIYAAQGSAAFLAMILSIAFLIKKFHYRPGLKINQTVLRKVVHYSFGNYAGNLFTILPTIIVPIIILNKLGAAPAGYYYLAFMMANILFAISYAVAQSLFAEGSYEEVELWSLIKRTSIFLAILIIPASLILAGLGPLVLNIFGKTYGEHSAKVIIILASAGPLMAACALGTVIMRITNHIRAIVLINFFYSLMICGLALLWAHRGLAWIAGAWLIGQGITAVIIFVALGLQYRQHQANARMPA
jgi:O-antigen/teichoic acid export membrane protein